MDVILVGSIDITQTSGVNAIYHHKPPTSQSQPL